ncbi:MAG: alcohol dehydrogenase [Prosthecobacter sp.]|nr:alcohol dehydrogenase [Prosthecobacter sp.]
MKFEFATASRIIFGRHTAAQAASLCREWGRSVLLVTGSHPERASPIIDSLRSAGLDVSVFGIQKEPTLQEARNGAVMAREIKAEAVIGLGGGSAVDGGKAVAALATQPGDALDYLEVVGQGRALDRPSLPFLAMPTTAGTGAEATRNAVLAVPEHGVKASLRHASMLPRVALIDPALALECPPEVTAASGMDALTQCLEAFVSCRAQPMTDALCLEGIRRSMRSLERAVNDGRDLDAREDMALAALYSGMALANAGLGAVHGFAAPVGGQFSAPHGAVCAALLAPVWEANLSAARQAAAPETLERFQTAAALLTGRPDAHAEAAPPVLSGLAERLRIPGLASYGIRPQDLDGLALKASRASSMKGNPVPLDLPALRSILQAAL